MLALPVAFAAGSMALLVSSAQLPAREDGLVELEVAAVLPLPEGPAGLLGAQVREIEIDEAEETSSGSRVRLAHGSRQVEIPARPSESVALAMAAGVPILATRRLLAEAGLTPEELAETREELAAGPSVKL
jgi:hypothetical protein